MTESLRRRAGFKKHSHLDWPGREFNRTIDLIVEPNSKSEPWIVKATQQIPEWRADVRDVYMRWAITINAMHVSSEHYKKHPRMGLETKTLRSDEKGRHYITILNTWTATDTARNYMLAMPALAAHAFADLYGLFEEIVFELYLIVLDGKPLLILQGAEFKDLRKLYHSRNHSEVSKGQWENAWAKRLSNWRKKRVYDGLHKVFAALFKDSKMKEPSDCKQSKIADWCEVIKGIGILRNLITHGVGEATIELEEISRKVPFPNFDFKEGEPINVDLPLVMFLECFMDQMLSTIGNALIELAYGKPVFSKT